MNNKIQTTLLADNRKLKKYCKFKVSTNIKEIISWLIKAIIYFLTMSLFYFPLIIFSLLGYGFTVSNKILNLKNENIGIYGLNGIFTFILISYLGCIMGRLTEFHPELINMIKHIILV